MNTVALPPAEATPYEIVFRHETERLPEATVIVPVWNGERFLRECCESIRQQRSVEIELVIVDDNSDDGSCALACKLVSHWRDRFARALVIRHAVRAGPAAGRDTGMRLATTQAALMLDVDNVIYPQCVRRCLDALDASSAAFVYPTLRLMGTKGGLQGYQQFDRQRLARGNYIDALAMVRRSAWADVGGFPHLAEGLEDYAFWLTLTERGYKGAQIPEILAAYRVHEAGRTALLKPIVDMLNERLEQAFPWVRLGRVQPGGNAPVPRPTAGNPDLFIDLMIRILTNTIYEDPNMLPGAPAAFVSSQRADGRDWPSLAHTMVGEARLRNLARLVDLTLLEKIPGDFIETGVWRGGCCILMRAILAVRCERQRRVFVADSFEGLPPPKPHRYPQDAGDQHHEYPQLAVSLGDVKANFARYGLLDEQVVFVKGFFDQTLPGLNAGPFALVRIDGDMYESTIVALQALYPKLSPGGFVIIDDFGAVEGCRLAVEDFRKAHDISEPMEQIDWTGVWWRKPATPRDDVGAEKKALTPTAGADARRQLQALSEAFDSRCAELGLAPNPLAFWYHTVDLGDGLVTPGSFDYRASIDQFGFPASLSGATALDVGSATGFFAFELERRGAAVVSVELPALSRWDHFPGETTTGIIGKLRERLAFHSLRPQGEIAELFRSMADDELYDVLLNGPFQFCRDRLRSKVERVYCTIYELEAALPNRRFDLVMLGDILVHSVDPLRALGQAAAVCANELVIADDIQGDDNEPAALRYVGGSRAESDIAEWWRPNVNWYRQVLARLGFREFEIGHSFETTVRPGGEKLHKRVIHAKR